MSMEFNNSAIDYGKIVKIGTRVLLCSFKNASLVVEELSIGGVLSAVKEVTTITCNAANTLVGGEYFLINSPTTNYCVWYTMNNKGARPPIGAVTFLKVNLYTDETSTVVATKTAAVINAVEAFVSTSAAEVITVTNAKGGTVYEPSDYDTQFIISVVTKGERKILFDNTLGRTVRKVLDVIIATDGSAEILVEAEFSRVTQCKDHLREFNTQYDYRAEYLVTDPGWLF